MTRATTRRAATLVSLSLAAVALMGCAAESGTAAPEPTDTPSANSEATPTPTPTASVATILAPLRGTEVATAIAGPSLAAKIDNHWDARPQWGLERTDIVFEELVEGGLTRYVAVWHSDVPAEIGPVRSIRPMDPDIIAPFGGIIAFSGGRLPFVQMMQATDVHTSIHGGVDDGFMYRSTEKLAPHNVVVRAPELRAAYDEIEGPPQQFDYAAGAAEASAARIGTAAKNIDVRFSAESSREWAWDATSSAYLRSQGGDADVDANGRQLRATNLITMQVAIDWRYGDVPKTVMIGSGKAWVSAGGKTLPVTWSKKNQTAPIVLTYRDDRAVTLAPGNTWIELVPQGGSVSAR